MDRPLAEYALLSDCHSGALVSSDGAVDWLCFPRFDSASVFGRLLDDAAGHWSIRPVREFTPERRYVEQTLVLETHFKTEGGTAVLEDALAVGPNQQGHDLGCGAPHALLRRLSCREGEVEFAMEYAPRPDYGSIFPSLSEINHALLARGGSAVMLLSSVIPLTSENSTAKTRFTLHAGQSVCFALQHRASSEPLPVIWPQDEITRWMEGTISAWRSWSVLHQNYQGPWRDLVHQSGRVLQGLTFYPTGAIVAAPTTSLPETTGGSRNWDYRYSWLRDASFTLKALWVAACPDEAHKFFHFLASTALTQEGRGTDLQIMFGVGGERELNERELPYLSGWRNSRPVRVGNDAWKQRQLDVYGEILDAAQVLSKRLQPLNASIREFLTDLADSAAERWTQQDQGIWEIRGEPRDFLYSKLMCWTALDRGIALAPFLGAEDREMRWRQVRDEIRNAILERGWNDRVGAFTQAFGSEDLDASVLMMPIQGLISASDPRMLSTIDVIRERLTDAHGLVYRYRSADGFAGQEGTFLLCTFWLAQALALAGKLREAKEAFTRAVSLANDVGLLSEEVDVHTGELLGNFPQAFSHVGLVNAAWAISQAEDQLKSGL